MERRLKARFAAVICGMLAGSMPVAAGAVVARVTAYGHIEYAWNDSQDDSSRPFFGGADVATWVGLPIVVKWVIRENTAPADRYPNDGSFFGDLYGIYRSDDGDSTSEADRDDRSFVVLDSVLVGSGDAQFELVFDSLQDYPAWNQIEEVFIFNAQGYYSSGEQWNLLDDAFRYTFEGGVEQGQGVYRESDMRMSAAAPAGHSSSTFQWLTDALFQNFDQYFYDTDTTSLGGGGIGRSERSYTCVYVDEDCVWSQYDQLDSGVLGFSIYRLVSQVRGVPEPGTLALLGLGLAGLGLSRRRKAA